MDDIVLRYQIERDDDAEANGLVVGKRRRLSWEMWSFLASAFLLGILPFTYKTPGEDWQYQFLVAPFVCFQLFFAMLYLFPSINARRHYRYSPTREKWFCATISGNGIRVEENGVRWESTWAAIRLIKESDRIFVLYDGYTMFILAKRYFNVEQLTALRKLISEHWPSESQLSR